MTRICLDCGEAIAPTAPFCWYPNGQLVPEGWTWRCMPCFRRLDRPRLPTDRSPHERVVRVAAPLDLSAWLGAED